MSLDVRASRYFERTVDGVTTTRSLHRTLALPALPSRGYRVILPDQTEVLVERVAMHAMPTGTEWQPGFAKPPTSVDFASEDDDAYAAAAAAGWTVAA